MTNRFKQITPAPATEFFDVALVKSTQSFIKKLNHNEVIHYRHAYRREMNNSNDDNVLPEHTVTKRRCFLYLTSHYENV